MKALVKSTLKRFGFERISPQDRDGLSDFAEKDRRFVEDAKAFSMTSTTRLRISLGRLIIL